MIQDGLWKKYDPDKALQFQHDLRWIQMNSDDGWTVELVEVVEVVVVEILWEWWWWWSGHGDGDDDDNDQTHAVCIQTSIVPEWKCLSESKFDWVPFQVVTIESNGKDNLCTHYPKELSVATKSEPIYNYDSGLMFRWHLQFMSWSIPPRNLGAIPLKTLGIFIETRSANGGRKRLTFGSMSLKYLMVPN